MTLDPVVLGQPHVDAHNNERAEINLLDAALASALSKISLERQYVRQHTDRRSKLPLTTEPVYTMYYGLLANLTKAYAFPLVGSDGAFREMTQAELDAIPIDMGFNAASVQHKLYQTSGYSYHYLSQRVAGTFFPSHYKFWTTSPLFQWLAYYTAGASTSAHQVYVDGQPMTLRPPMATYAVSYESLTFPDRRWREIDIFTSAAVGGFYFDPADMVSKVEPSNSPKLFYLGDSYGMTVFTDNGTATGLQEEVLPATIETQLGLDHQIINAIGGTGFITRTNNTNNNYVDRLQDLLVANPDLLWVPNNAANDVNQRAGNAGAPTDAQIVAAVRAVLGSYRAQNPTGKIVYGYGHTPPVYFAALRSQLVTLGDAVRAACTDIGVYYVDSTSWLTGTGYIGGAAVTAAGYTVTSGSANVTNGSPGNIANVGAPISGTGIPAGAYVVNNIATGYTISAPATSSASNVTISLASTRKNGNTDWAIGSDGVHPTGLGTRYLRGRWAQKLRKILVDDGTLLNQLV